MLCQEGALKNMGKKLAKIKSDYKILNVREVCKKKIK
jgi:hypothetical protein